MAKRKNQQNLSKNQFSLPNGNQNQRNSVDIIIPVFNGFDILSSCLDSISAACGNVEHNILIWDNGSNKEEADKFYSSIKAVRSRKNIGFVGACNEAAKLGNSKYIFLLNSDVILFPNSIEYAFKDMDNYPEVGVLGFKLLFPPNTPSGPENTIQHMGIETNIRGEFYHQFIGWNPNNPKVLAKREALAVTGAALFTRRELWHRYDGLDRIYGMGCLDKDSLLITSEGIKTIKSFNNGDGEINDISVLVPGMGKTQRSLSNISYNNGLSETIKITTTGKFEVVSTYNHKFIVMNDDGNYDWKEAENIKPGDYIAIRGGSDLWGDNKITNRISYLSGLYVADGSYDGRRITITKKFDDNVRTFLSSCGFSLHGDKNFRANNKSYPYFDLESVGMDFSLKAPNKEVPSGILESNRSSMISFLRGLFDCDGTAVKDGRVAYSSCSIKLIKQLQIILLNFGIVSSYSIRHVGDRPNPNYVLDLGCDSSKFYDLIGFSLDRKQENSSKVRKRLGYDIPFQRKYVKILHDMLPTGYKHLSSSIGNHKSHLISESSLSDFLFLCKKCKLNLEDEYIHLKSILDLGIYWAKVLDVQDNGVVETYDLHVPDTHLYVANGFISHNTWEDVDYCLKVRADGKNVIISQRSVGFHYTGATSRREKQAFPINENMNLFMARWSGHFPWTEWRSY